MSDADVNARGQSSKSQLRDLLHQRNKPSAAGDFELAKDRVRCFFTIGKLKQASLAISWLLRPSQTRRATSCSRLVSRTRCGKRALAADPVDRSGATAQILALDKKMRARYPDRHELLQLNCCAQMGQSRMMHPLFFKTC
jgi:hypothetical protein